MPKQKNVSVKKIKEWIKDLKNHLREAKKEHDWVWCNRYETQIIVLSRLLKEGESNVK